MESKSESNYIYELEKSLGKEYVDCSFKSLNEAETATFHTSNSIEVIVCPYNKEEVKSCLAIANQYKKSVYPISKGKNWGYGSRVPSDDKCILLSLERLNRITNYNEQLANVTVEPGVSFDQLNNFLRDQDSNLMLSAPGTTPEASVIGNVLERGVVQGVYADRCDFICGMEVLLPDGRIIQTGMKSFPNSNTFGVHKWGVGPSLDGLFIQSNLGIVLSVTVWLVPMPKFHQQFHFNVNSEVFFSKAINILQQLKLNGTIRSSCSMFNDYRLLTMMNKFPFDKTNESPLPQDIKKEMMGELGEGWFLLGAIEGESQPELEAKKEIVKTRLNELEIDTGFSTVNEDNAVFSFKLKSGLSSVYWRKKPSAIKSMNPDKDKCGVLFIGFIAPFTGANILESCELMTKIMCHHNFEPAISIQAITDRNVCVLASILYDREESKQDEKGWNCYTKLLEEMTELGYYPYRLTSESMNILPKRSDNYDQVLSKIKKLLDPNLILAPGRYIQ